MPAAAVGHVYHWKHGWIPLDHTGAVSAAGIQNRGDLAKAILGLPNIHDPAQRQKVSGQIVADAQRIGATDLLLSGMHGSGAAGRLTPKQLDALDPGTRRNEASISKDLAATPAGKNVLDMIKGFTERRGGVANLRSNIAATLDGSASPAVSAKVHDFLDAMNTYPTSKVPILYRGVAVKMDENTPKWWNDFESKYKVGKELDLNASSFSSSERKAGEFQMSLGGTKMATSKHVQMRFVLDGGAHALPVEQLSKFKSEKEWMAGGRFTVTKFDPATPKRPYYVIHIKQTASLK